MSKWLSRLKEAKNTVLHSNNEVNTPLNQAQEKAPNTLASPNYPTLLDSCVPDGIEVSGKLPDTSHERNPKNNVPDDSNTLYGEASGKHLTLPDTSNPPSAGLEPRYQGIKLPPCADTIPRLPFALERLVSAASSDQLTGFSFDGVLDINSYVRAWAYAYLVGDQQHALDRLNQVQTARELSR